MHLKLTSSQHCAQCADIETVNINNVEVPVAISLVILDYNFSQDIEKHFFTIDKSRLKYNGGKVLMETLDKEVLKMWSKLHKTLIQKESEGYVAIKYIFVHNLGGFVRRQVISYLNI